jgi:hypothetical protein
MVFTNGDFETGDLTGWTENGTNSGSSSQASTVDAAAKRSGTYGLKLDVNADTGGDATASRKSTTFSSDFISVDLWYKCATIGDGPEGKIEVKILVLDNLSENYEHSIAYIEDLTAGDWIQLTINKGDITLPEGFSWPASTYLVISTRLARP